MELVVSKLLESDCNAAEYRKGQFIQNIVNQSNFSFKSHTMFIQLEPAVTVFYKPKK